MRSKTTTARGGRTRGRGVREHLVERTSSLTRFAWSAEQAELLGRVPDRAVAEKVGLSERTIGVERRRRRIAAARERLPAIDWSPEMVALLGSDTDAQVGAILGVPRHCVGRKRNALRIPPYQLPPYEQYEATPWQAEDLALLGMLSDREIAERIGVSSCTVHRKRERLGIRPSQPGPKRIQWTAETLGRLGKASDAEVAAELGVSRASVRRKRQELGIAACYVRTPIVRKVELTELLSLPTREARRRSGLKPETIVKLRRELAIRSPHAPDARWPPEVIARLGHEPDASIAEDIGVTPSRVGAKRRELAISGRRSWNRWRTEEVALLGTAPDAQIAARLGRPEANVRAKRIYMRIPVVLEPRQSAAPLARRLRLS